MTLTITRKLEFDYGHRVVGHEGKCRNLHGHRGVAEITVSAAALDSLGRVIDFSALKSVVGGWIDANWDHNMILNPNDPLLHEYSPDDVDEGLYRLVGRHPFIMPDDLANPTAENLAVLLFQVARDLLAPHGICVDSVRLWETPNSFADYSGE